MGEKGRGEIHDYFNSTITTKKQSTSFTLDL